jgi:exo-beta-1,3-glucanase (GH17 family)
MAGGVMGALGGIVGKSAAKSRSGGSSGQYGPVHNAGSAYRGGGGTYELGAVEDKSPWLAKQKGSSRKWKWAIILGIGLIIAAAVIVGVLFGYVFKKKSGDTSTPDSSGDLDINSREIQALLNNPNLHKVFPGMDYTPLNTQYPDCVHNPPSQNNITKDVAVLSQLTDTIRLYGTDCNQTQMTLHALDKLGMNDTIKLWLGVWQDNNATTNARQLDQMWDILKKYGEKPFKGLIVANEILFREQMDISTLGQLLATVRSNLTANGMSLPVATSDLGNKWTAGLAAQSDYVMANIHPFFGGVNAKDASSWTWSFWENQNGPVFKSDASKNIISETGWPSQGGTDCGTDAITVCPDASVAGIDELNRFMEDWVCQALANGTQYFWFEAFDEPWKISFNNGTKNWEDHWGLMDVNRNLKDGVKIPDCGGKTI